jgi:putative endonuclease
MGFFGYILCSSRNGSYYVGQTRDLAHRLKLHNAGHECSTKSGVPWKLVFYKEFPTRADATRWEHVVKSKKSRKFIENLISSFTPPGKPDGVQVERSANGGP